MPAQYPSHDALNEGSRLRMLRGLFDDPRALLTAMGALTVKQSQRAFREQRMGNVRWKTRGDTRMNPNWPAILADMAAGRASVPERRFRDSPVLVDTGMLKRSVTWRLVGRDTVEIGSNLPYAGVLHAGGESKTVPITKAVQDRLSDWIDRTFKRGQRAAKRKWSVGTTPQQMARDAKAQQRGSVALRLQWLLNPSLRGQRLTVRHPPRPIVGFPPDLVREIEREVGVKVRAG